MLERHNGEITVLFDVDETIGKLKTKPDDTYHTVTRPALAPVAQTIAGTSEGRVSYGLLSSRGQSYLDTEAQERAYTAPLGKALDHLHQEHPEQAFILVDDLAFVKSIDPNHPQVHGVHIDTDARFYC